MDQEHIESAEKTRDLVHWAEIFEKSDASRTREYFFWLMKNHDPSEGEVWKDHAFWKNWRSKKSVLSALHYAGTNAKNPEWITSLARWGVPVNQPNTPTFISAFSRPSTEIVAFCEAFARAGCDFKTNANTHVSFLSECARVGSYDALVFFGRTPFFPTTRQRDVEQAFIQHRYINGRKAKDNKKDIKDVLSFLWERWGEPGLNDMRELNASALRYASKNPGASHFLWERFNPSHPLWEEHDDRNLCLNTMAAGRTHDLVEKIQAGYNIPNAVLDAMTEIARTMARFDPESFNRVLELRSLQDKRRLEEALVETAQHQPARLNKKM